MRIVCISDTHLRHDFKVPEGDILIHAGDLTSVGSLNEVTRAAKWLGGIRIGGGFANAIVIPGNHDWLGERDPIMMRLLVEEAGCTYLQHQSAVVGGLRVFGSGYTPRFFDWALNMDRGPKLAALWSQIPDDTQVLITHGPPHGVLDTVNRPEGDADRMDYFQVPKSRHLPTHVGCEDLRDRVHQLKSLKVHIFGHIHQPGMVIENDITFVNASICNERYEAVYAPLVIDL